VPPLAFLVMISTVRAIVRRERIVFYQTAVAAVVATALVAFAARGRVARMTDVVVLGIGVFLCFGRIGCFSVACCHGVPARFGVIYGLDHARAGFWARWAGRRLWPTQLVECATSLVLVVAGLAVGWDRPGIPALIYVVGYAVVRFALELVRGDSTRPYMLGLSEAQWTALGTLIACAAFAPSVWTLVPAAGALTAVVWLVMRRAQRAPFLAPHLVELERALRAAGSDGARHETSLGVAVSTHTLPDGRTDCVWSASQPWWSIDAARRIAEALWPTLELVPGRHETLVHVIVNEL
jgi:hypothetical protein